MCGEGRGKAASLASWSTSSDRLESCYDCHRSTAPAQRRRCSGVVRHPRCRQGVSAARPVPVPGDQRVGQRHAQPDHIQGFYGAGLEDTSRAVPFGYDADHPAVLVGSNQGPTPVEFLLHAIAACLTSGLANIAAARGITLRRVSSTVEGDIDLLGILGLSAEVRNGYRQIRVHFDIEGDASAEQLTALVEQSRSRSAVYDVLVNGTDVCIDVTAR